MRSMGNALAMAVSIGLQYGVPLQEFVQAFVYSEFEPRGAIQGHDRLRFCTSLLDAIFRHLAIDYLGMDKLAHVPKDEPTAGQVDQIAEAIRGSAIIIATEEERRSLLARHAGYTGSLCGQCGSTRVVRSGSCVTCQDCGSTSGCV
jgi:ribonucleoside-diphosphate reductase alpha chain